jgi:hypothetical protein
MPRKNNDNNPLQLGVRVKSVPKYATPKRVYQRLIQHMTEGKPLPPNWDIEVRWRNPKTKHGKTKRWQSDDFESAVDNSREGFNALLHEGLVRKLRRLQG